MPTPSRTTINRTMINRTTVKSRKNQKSHRSGKDTQDKLILSIDQGTTGTTVGLMNKKGHLVVKINKEFRQIYPQPGWVEHSPEEIWQSVLWGIKKCLQKAGVSGAAIEAIGITNQRETVVAWDRKTGHSLYNAIVWQCRRTSQFCEGLKSQGVESLIRTKTGLVIDPYFSASKIRWLLDHVKGAKSLARSGGLAVGTQDAYLLWKLTGGREHKTDVSNASRTQLMNIHSLQWDDELLELFGVARHILPEICPSSGLLGVTSGVPGLPDGVPIAGMAGDQQAALFGQACFKSGEAKVTFGTGSFLLMNTGSQAVSSQSGLLTTVAWQLGEQKPVTYALEGGAFICGAAVQWLRDELQFFKSSADVEKLAQTVKDTGGVEFVPALVGLGAPYWDSEARGLMCGLTRGTHRGHIARAVLEAMALQNVDILEAMQKDAQKKLKNVRVDGGAVANNLLMQMQADFVGRRILRPQSIESTVVGAAFLAGLAVGFWQNTQDLVRVWKLDREFVPGWKEARRKTRMESWHRAIQRAML